MNLAIGILVGGKSGRMGTPKALITIGGATLLDRTVETARLAASDILLLGQPLFELPSSLLSLPIVPDYHPHLGPIGGLESLLLARTSAHCILLACDMPNLTAELLKRMIEPTDECDAAVCSTSTDPPWHPCCAMYKPTCLAAVQAAIGARQYGMMELLSRLRVRRIQLTGDDAGWVENWNEPKDLTAETLKPRGPCS